MGHCPYNQLKDLEPVLNQIRGWAGVKEKGQGIFYLKGQAFLHFHLQDGKRWADIKIGKNWGEPVDVAFGLKPVARARFLAEARDRYERTLGKK